MLGGANYGYAVVRFLLNLWWFMKILNLKTNNIFNLPKNEAKKLLEESPEDFIKTNGKLKQKVSAPKKTNSIDKDDKNSILSQILE